MEQAICNTTEPTASLEWLVGVLRVHPHGGCWQDGSPFAVSITIQRHPERPDEAITLGMDQPVTREQMRAIERCLREHGFRIAWAERIRADGSRTWKRMGGRK